MLYLAWIFGGFFGAAVGAVAGWCTGQVVVSKIAFGLVRRSMESARK